MKKRDISFRWFIILLMFSITLLTLAVSGTAIFRLQEEHISDHYVKEMAETVRNLGLRTEVLLQSVEQTLVTLTYACRVLDRKEFANLLVDTAESQPLIRSIYFLDENGKTFAVWKPDNSDPLNPDYIAIDFSYTPMFKKLKENSGVVWSDKFVSAMAGDISIGVGIRMGDRAAIAELELGALLKTVESVSDSDTQIRIIDRLGEVLVDSSNPQNAGSINLRNEPIVQQAISGQSLPETVDLEGRSYYPGAYRSEKLGWLFLAGVPAGLDNPRVQAVLTDILLFSGSFLIIALLLSPFWSYVISSHIVSLRGLADGIAGGGPVAEYRKGRIGEFNALSDNLKLIGERIRKREDDLKKLNQELEQRVALRTEELEARNSELKQSLDNNIQMRDLLVKTEKMAALGRLVAGIAHELNTPIGNAVMTISTLTEELKLINEELEKGLRKSSLERFLAQSGQGLKIAERNVERAAELISSFKHVASDQTSSVRRKFELSAMVEDVLLTLHPTLKRSPHELEADIGENLILNSYPGTIGQIMTNLITNALLHAWDEGQQGFISIRAQKDGNRDWVTISVADNGKGISAEMGDKIFDPFFTTKMGKGGTGLGLNIAYNGAVNILGGELRFESVFGQGTTFYLEIPLVAPRMEILG